MGIKPNSNRLAAFSQIIDLPLIFIGERTGYDVKFGQQQEDNYVTTQPTADS